MKIPKSICIMLISRHIGPGIRPLAKHPRYPNMSPTKMINPKPIKKLPSAHGGIFFPFPNPPYLSLLKREYAGVKTTKFSLIGDKFSVKTD
jgi:hypothetical protein